MDILKKLQTEWPSDCALQPITANERRAVIEIQAIKKEAANEIRFLRAWVKDEGLRSNVCTKDVLGEICDNCQCGKK